MNEELMLKRILQEIKDLKEDIKEITRQRQRIPLKEFAAMMGVSRSTMRRRVDDGLYDHVKYGNRIYILYDKKTQDV